MGLKDKIGRHPVIATAIAAALVIGLVAGGIAISFAVKRAHTAAEEATMAEATTSAATTTKPPDYGTLADAERYAQQAISYGKSKNLTYVASKGEDTGETSWLAFSKTVLKSADYQEEVEKSFEYAEQCWLRYSFTPLGRFAVEVKTAGATEEGDIYEVQISFLGNYFKNP